MAAVPKCNRPARTLSPCSAYCPSCIKGNSLLTFLKQGQKNGVWSQGAGTSALFHCSLLRPDPWGSLGSVAGGSVGAQLGRAQCRGECVCSVSPFLQLLLTRWACAEAYCSEQREMLAGKLRLKAVREGFVLQNNSTKAGLRLLRFLWGLFSYHHLPLVWDYSSIWIAR